MASFDTQTLMNWIISGLIGLCFGIVSTWITYRYERKRDDIAWKREKEKLQQQFDNDQKLAKLEFQQKLEELTQGKLQDQSAQIRGELLKGVDNSADTIDKLAKMQEKLLFPNVRVKDESWREGYAFGFLLLFFLGIGQIYIAFIAFPQNSSWFVVLVSFGVFITVLGASIGLIRVFILRKLLDKVNERRLNSIKENLEKN